MAPRKLPRRRIQRAFCHWLHERQAMLPFRLVVDRRTDRAINCRIAHVCPNIVVSPTHEVNIIAELNGECWDLLSCFECIPRREVDDYTCPLCVAADRPSYPCRARFWEARLFEPLACWLNSLASAHWLLFYENGGGTWAKLNAAPDLENVPQPYLVAAIPVHGKEG
jgi:hypothetical protein